LDYLLETHNISQIEINRSKYKSNVEKELSLIENRESYNDSLISFSENNGIELK
jgi:hypothetical protein